MTEFSTGTFDDGAAYERLMGRWSRLAGRAFLTWCDVQQGQTWLDVGCGNGAFTEEILERANPKDVTGVDPSPGQIAYARARNRAATYRIGDAMALPFADASFDVSVMALAIAFVPDPARALSEMARVTKPGGLVATYMWDLPNAGVHLAPFYRTLKDMGLPGPMPPHAQISRREALETLWQDAGLQGVESCVIRIEVAFSDFDDFWNANTVAMGPMGERLKTMTAEQIAAFKVLLRQAVPAKRDGSITYEAFANAVKARR
jgi:SAM-dependent methyltransferase